ncbi:uncharacterized protein LOC113125204 [Mastacembelus armatus]|uniref:uncharacterized protein LOC113125204 n=1 Tax=Mastacembelus armatus TaxID=205130 RepID=UPI001436AFFD|nr:uncharacterized protein LOC113125204 [Mastacembelus armatus]
MGHTLLSVLGLFLLNTNLYCGYTQDVVLTLQPNRSVFFSGEINFTIEMKVTMQNCNYSIHRKDEQVVSCGIKKSCSLKIQKNHSGEYWATVHHQSTNVIKKLSNKVNLTVLDQPKPVLTVSPSWLSPGTSVTLNCEVEHPSAGWRFYWYKAVPKLSGDSYSYELLPGSSSGTEQDSYMVHGQTHTAGYVCRAGRGDPVFYTQYSPTRFAWSAGQYINYFSVTNHIINSRVFSYLDYYNK